MEDLLELVDLSPFYWSFEIILDAKTVNTLAMPYNHRTHKENRIGFVVMYSLTFFFANFGPNATTFVVPAEIFPVRLRSTCHGISAASGKAGAIVGAFGFLYAAQNQDPTKTNKGYPPGIGVRNALMVLGGVNFLGMVFTFLVPESKGKSLEEMSQENKEDEDGSTEMRQQTCHRHIKIC
ncbi:inorganic phosphate transporter 1-4-like [Camellia sinensis]|uniref:inorganic phosphate transporter 1-4-like n=1 Tax=Camellia sinensis TaxID=4442 RepID=UPI00103585CB|nr:inorganic phosphate transporter 1-4-like [Camellia sinensis]